MIIAGCCLFCLLYIVCTLRQDFYHAWHWLVPAVAACFLAVWSMPELSPLLAKAFAEGDLQLLQLFCPSAAILLTGAIVLIALRIAVGKLAPLVDPEFPVWFDRGASFAARLVTSLAIATWLLQSALALPLAATVDSFTSTAEKADAVALFGSAFLNRLSCQGARSAKQRESLEGLREKARRSAKRLEEIEKEEQEKAAAAAAKAAAEAAAAAAKNKKNPAAAAEAAPAQAAAPPPPSFSDSLRLKLQRLYKLDNPNAARGTPETQADAAQPDAAQPAAAQPAAAEAAPRQAAPPPEVSGSSVSKPGTMLNRTRSRIRNIYDNHNRNLESGGAAQ